MSLWVPWICQQVHVKEAVLRTHLTPAVTDYYMSMAAGILFVPITRIWLSLTGSLVFDRETEVVSTTCRNPEASFNHPEMRLGPVHI